MKFNWFSQCLCWFFYKLIDIDQASNLSTVTYPLMYPFGLAAGDTNASFTPCTNGILQAIQVNGFSFLGLQRPLIYVSEIRTLLRAQLIKFNLMHHKHPCNIVVGCHILTNLSCSIHFSLLSFSYLLTIVL